MGCDFEGSDIGADRGVIVASVWEERCSENSIAVWLVDGAMVVLRRLRSRFLLRGRPARRKGTLDLA